MKSLFAVPQRLRPFCLVICGALIGVGLVFTTPVRADLPKAQLEAMKALPLPASAWPPIEESVMRWGLGKMPSANSLWIYEGMQLVALPAEKLVALPEEIETLKVKSGPIPDIATKGGNGSSGPESAASGALKGTVGNVTFNQAAASLDVQKVESPKSDDLSRQFGSSYATSTNTTAPANSTSVPGKGWVMMAMFGVAIIAIIAFSMFYGVNEQRHKHRPRGHRRHHRRQPRPS